MNTSPSASVALCFDRNYRLQAATCIRSLGTVWLGPGLPEVDLIHAPDLRDGDIEALARVADESGVRVRFVSASEQLDLITERLPPARFPHLSESAWLKVFVPGLLYDRTRVLYLDCDTLICSDLSALIGRPLPPGVFVEAVRDFGIPELGTQFLSQDRFSVQDSEAGRPYFNSGVMHIDIGRWSAARVTDSVVEAAWDSSDPMGPLFGDQDLLNMVVRGRFEMLDPRYNVALMGMIRKELGFDHQGRTAYPDDYLAMLASDARILHFVTGLKPWSAAYPAEEPYGRRWRSLAAEAWEIARS